MSQIHDASRLTQLLEFEREIRQAVNRLDKEMQECDFQDERNQVRIRFSNVVKNAVGKLP